MTDRREPAAVDDDGHGSRGVFGLVVISWRSSERSRMKKFNLGRGLIFVKGR
jgi:hypothetical protein